jgi:hypothetical protein
MYQDGVSTPNPQYAQYLQQRKQQSQQQKNAEAISNIIQQGTVARDERLSEMAESEKSPSKVDFIEEEEKKINKRSQKLTPYTMAGYAAAMPYIMQNQLQPWLGGTKKATELAKQRHEKDLANYNENLKDLMSGVSGEKLSKADAISKLGNAPEFTGPANKNEALGKLLYGHQDKGGIFSLDRQLQLRDEMPFDMSIMTPHGMAIQGAMAAAPMVPAVSMGLGSARQASKLRQYREMRKELGGVGRTAETSGSIGSAIRSATIAPGAAMFAMQNLPGIGGLAGAGAGAWKSGVAGLTKGLGESVLGGAGNIASLVGADGLAGGLKAAAGSSMGAGLMGGGLLALPSIISGISGMVADKKKKRFKATKQPHFKVEKQFAQSTNLGSVVGQLASAGQLQAADQIKIELLRMIESQLLQ